MCVVYFHCCLSFLIAVPWYYLWMMMFLNERFMTWNWTQFDVWAWGITGLNFSLFLRGLWEGRQDRERNQFLQEPSLVYSSYQCFGYIQSSHHFPKKNYFHYRYQITSPRMNWIQNRALMNQGAGRQIHARSIDVRNDSKAIIY